MLGKYGVEFKFTIPIPKLDDTDFAVTGDWTPVAGDVKISKDGGNVTNIAALPSAVGGVGSVLWQFTLSTTEMEAKEIAVQVVDAALENQVFIVQTYGHANAQIVELPADVVKINGGTTAATNLKTAGDAYSATRGFAGTALPGAVADAAGGLPISDDGGLDMDGIDAQLVILAARLSAVRAGYLDNLNVGALVASAADVAGITQAQRVRVITAGIMERPDSGSTTYRIWMYAYDETHIAEDLDSNPTVTAENNAGTDRSSNLSAVTKDGTGVYRIDYTLADSDAIEQLVFQVTATEGGVATEYAASAQVVDTTAVDFTAADRTKLDDLETRCTEARLSELDATTAGKMANQVDEIRTDTGEIGAAGVGLTDLGGMSDAMKAEVNAEAKDVLVTDTSAELTAVPAAVSSIADRIAWQFLLTRNKGLQTEDIKTIRNDDDDADIATAAVSDDDTTFTRGKFS